ncbi:HNH endonuclease [Streptococcus sanguinis]|uniref:HNH endonuclease signature motif containing protein n=1 Tax=Streptococcus sanguinis TaxID=1305 RepID=UPI002284B7C2|nr:HNH endonuclease signature motif containing protein [Streptococcus sanguinis]MCY7016156.1 HNH endonuclease [Streptococcus sanguinis]
MYSKIVPGNYFITKSMEWMRLSKEINGETINLGNYWFLRKFLTYYNYIFSKKMDVETRDVYKDIQINFENFISSLPKSQREDAEKYFFEIDIREEKNFFNWTEYYDTSKQPGDKNEAYKYKTNAKKIYFVYLMQLGGQSGEKRELLFFDLPNKIPYHELVTKYNSQILNDVHAILRNMRQVLYYYGMLFRFETSRVEEYSLTRVGELLVYSTSLELSLLMEHQKIKMVSQPPTIEIKNVTGINSENFEINLNPYNKILSYIDIYEFIDRDHYKYVVSRNLDINAKKELAQSKIDTFSRSGDKSNEDFNKELKKYLYGLWDSNIPALNFLQYKKKGNTFKVVQREKLKEYVSFVSSFKDYKEKKLEKDKKLYENILKRYYRQTIKNVKLKDLYQWLGYISTPEEELVESLLLFFVQENQGFKSTKKEYPNLFQFFNISKEKWEKLTKLKDNSRGSNCYYKLIVELDLSKDIDGFDNDFTTISFQKQHVSELVEKSNETFNQFEARQRKHISYIKSYYELLNVESCDCCGEGTFKKENGKHYFEYHHLIPISQSGPDHVLNLFGICPNCHRKFHFENSFDRIKNYENIDKNNFLKKQKYENSSIYDRMSQLYFDDKIDLFALNYLVREQFFDEMQIEEIIIQKATVRV